MASQEYEQPPRFELLLAELSAEFINLPSDRVDAAIDEAQRRVCECLDLDLSGLWQRDTKGNAAIVLTHLCRPGGGPPVPERMEAEAHFPWCLQQVMSGEVSAIPSTENAPPEACRDLESWRQFGIKAGLNIPLSAGGCRPFGVLSFSNMRCEYAWPESLISRLRLVAQIFANAIVRRAREEALRSSQALVAAAMDVAEVGCYETGADAQVSFLDDRIRSLLGITPEEETHGREFWLAHVHPEDRDEVSATAKALREDALDRVTLEYRYLHPSRGSLWFQHAARVQERNAAGCAIRAVGVISDVTVRKHAEEELKRTLQELQTLRDQLQNENVYLREQMLSESGHGTIVGESEPIQKMLAMARKVAPTGAAVLITGETGTGKELLAQAIHDLSSRKKKTMVKVNCAALPAQLIESELFGRERGAYTGAMTQQVGRFEIADGSTIFLDEIGDLPLDLQAKLLRVLQDGQYERLGSHRSLKTDARVIAATNRDLSAMVKDGRFREDLFHRLNVFPIEVPPLRMRVLDIPLLVWTFVQVFNTKMGRLIDVIPKATMEQLKHYPWPGNIRELRNVIERAMIVSEGRSLKIELPALSTLLAAPPSTMEALERQHILEVLKQVRWKISGKGGAAEILDLVPTTLHSRMKKLGISRPAP